MVQAIAKRFWQGEYAGAQCAGLAFKTLALSDDRIEVQMLIRQAPQRQLSLVLCIALAVYGDYSPRHRPWIAGRSN